MPGWSRPASSRIDVGQGRYDTGYAANWRSSSTGQRRPVSAPTVADATTNYLPTISSNGFNVGTTNRAGVLYHFVAFQNTTNLVNVGTYEGTTADNRNILTGVGFVPDYLFIKNADYAAGSGG